MIQELEWKMNIWSKTRWILFPLRMFFMADKITFINIRYILESLSKELWQIVVEEIVVSDKKKCSSIVERLKK